MRRGERAKLVEKGIAVSAYKRKDRGGHWYYRRWVVLPSGERVKIGGKAPLNTKDSALRAEREHVQRLLSPPPIIETPAAMPTVRQYTEQWVARREELGLTSVGDDEARLRLHVFPVIGDMPMGDVKPRHMRDLILALRSGGNLAARTILKTSGTLHSMFKSAFVEELITSNPVVFEPGVLPKKADKDPEWRHQAIYTRDEIEALISDDRIPADRRMLYAFKCLAALRHGEVAELLWRQLDTSTKPQGRINLGKTKSGVPRAVPIHPTLAKMLATWKLAGWFNTYGRQPTADDLVVPTLTLKPRISTESQDALVIDLKILKLRVEAGKHMDRRGHDLRRTFVSLAQADGARRDVIEWGTHGPRGDIMSMYTSLPWPTLCEEWSKLKIALREGALISLRHDKPSAMTIRGRKRWQGASSTAWTPSGPRPRVAGVNAAQVQALIVRSEVTPSGLEPEFSA